MANFTKLTDYSEGVFKLPQNSLSAKELLSFISDVEEDVLECLLGCDLFELFTDSLDNDNNSSETRFQNIIDKFCIQNNCGEKVKSKGVKVMLQGFVYFYYGRQLNARLTHAGSKEKQSETSKDAMLSSTLLVSNYNKSAHYYSNIQTYIKENITEYPEYKGVSKEFITPL